MDFDVRIEVELWTLVLSLNGFFFVNKKKRRVSNPVDYVL